MTATQAIQICPALPTDADAIAAIDLDGRTKAPEVLAELDRPIARLWVAVVQEGDAVPLAFGALAGPPEVWAGTRVVCGFLQSWLVLDELHILNLVTHASMRRRGVAKRLLRHALQRASASGAATCLLEVRPSNEPARALYASVGFTVTHRRARYYDDGEDALEMALSIDPRMAIESRDEDG